MVITEIKAQPIEFQLKEEIWSAGSQFSKRSAVIISIKTDDGYEGIGEAFSVKGPSITICNVIEKELSPLLLGEDPCYISYLWDKMYNNSFLRGRRGIFISGISGIDTALWDILGKKSNLPIYKLLGGFRDKILAYASAGHYANFKGIKQLREEMEKYVNSGFKAVKMKIGKLTINEDIKRIKAVREVIGSGILLMVDGNRNYDLKSAIKISKAIEKYDINWFEEPVSPDQITASKLVTQKVDIPIAGYETESSIFAFRELIANQALDIVQQDVSMSGGFTECKRIANLAYAWGLKYSPHSFGSAVALAANLHLVASLPNGYMIEFDQNPSGIRDELLYEPIKIDRDGYVHLPQKPGLGIKINMEAMERFKEK